MMYSHMEGVVTALRTIILCSVLSILKTTQNITNKNICIRCNTVTTAKNTIVLRSLYILKPEIS